MFLSQAIRQVEKKQSGNSVRKTTSRDESRGESFVAFALMAKHSRCPWKKGKCDFSWGSCGIPCLQSDPKRMPSPTATLMTQNATSTFC